MPIHLRCCQGTSASLLVGVNGSALLTRGTRGGASNRRDAAVTPVDQRCLRFGPILAPLRAGPIDAINVAAVQVLYVCCDLCAHLAGKKSAMLDLSGVRASWTRG